MPLKHTRKITPELERLLAQEEVILEVTEQICKHMSHNGISRSDLAKRMGKSKSYVSQILNGSRNFTIRTLVDVARAIGINIKIDLIGKDDLVSSRSHRIYTALTLMQYVEATKSHITTKRRTIQPTTPTEGNTSWLNTEPYETSSYSPTTFRDSKSDEGYKNTIH